MKHSLFTFFLTFTFLYASSQINAKPDSLNVYQRLDVSYTFGGQVYNDNFTYNPGIAVFCVTGLMPNDNIGLGFVYGFHSMQNERFIPLGAEVIGYKSGNKGNSFIRMQAGYSIGWYQGETSLVGHNYSGGLFVDAGIGRKIYLADDLSVMFTLSYRHQFAKTEYEIFGKQTFTETLNFDMLVISLSLLRNN
ncbi:MAG: hypothetical protein JXB34_13265 [Bacteroidales bacterium]|nr:hypothetical protein [Bacteroidales bacterium]